ncbi:MAG: enoyl-CoA hydratase/isomerase family protein [Myxococcales bacterium]|nr:enoyl-CoA hydratase/isomerase family protein [Myxococcales bacterium]
MSDWDTGTPGLRVARDAAVLRLHLDRPEKHNAIGDAVLLRLIECIEGAGIDESVRVIALSAEGENFCSGFDLVARNTPEGPRPRVGSIQRRLPLHAHRLIPAMLSVQTPIVCAARGHVAGIGLHLLLASDFALVARGARLWEPFVTRGFSPDSGGSWLLPRFIGVARAKEMLMLGREVSGEEAADWGLVHAAVDDGELEPRAEALVEQLGEAATVAVGLSKWLVGRGLATSLDDALANEAFALELSSRSLDFKEGMKALREKRKPGYTGR